MQVDPQKSVAKYKKSISNESSKMKLAIHHSDDSFSERWIQYCRENNIDFKIVDCYQNDIIAQLEDCDGLMWHWSQDDYKARLFARQLILSLDKKGLKVFPDVNTCWHFDDKLGQKYLLEAAGVPLVNSYVFYTKAEALAWLKSATFPLVFKLRSGASSVNVSLVKNRTKAKYLVNKAFGRGFLHLNRFHRFKERVRILKRDKTLESLWGVVSGFARLIIPTQVEHFSQNEKGYIYFQDYIPGLDYDSRLIVIGGKCIGVRRYCRKGDFRASGSGIKEYDPSLFEIDSVKIAFEIAAKLKTQSLALDFIPVGDKWKIVEISYGFIMGKFYDDCLGYWDTDLQWHEAKVNPQYFIIEEFIRSIEEQKQLKATTADTIKENTQKILSTN